MREIDPIRHAALAALAHDPLTVGVPAEPQPETDLHFRNWRWLIDRDGIGWALLDKPGSSVNTLSEEVFERVRCPARPDGAGADRGARDPLAQAVGLHRRGRDPRIRRHGRRADHRRADRQGPGGARPAGGSALPFGGADPWLLPGRRPRTGAGGELSHCDQGGAARLSRGDARASSRARRHLAVAAHRRSGRGNDHDGGRKPGVGRSGAPRRARRCGDRGAAFCDGAAPGGGRQGEKEPGEQSREPGGRLSRPPARPWRVA